MPRNWTRQGREGDGKPPIYWYTGTPAAVDLEGIQVKQKGRAFYVVAAPASDIDRLCSVPVVPYSTSNSDIAISAMAQHDTAWQRELDPNRTAEIAKFFGQPAGLIVNAAVIGLPRTATFYAKEEGRAVCRFPVSWPKRQCPSCQWMPPAGDPHAGALFDACPECNWEGRTARIIDGQHRIRGCAAAAPPRCDEPLVATVLVEDQFSASDEARIFTEITTSAVDLHPLHKLFLLYKFGLRGFDVGSIKDADFRSDRPPSGARNTLGLRNRRAYQIACSLVSDNTSRWFNRVSMFPGTPRSRRGDVIDADVLVELIERQLQNGPLLDEAQPDGMVPAGAGASWIRGFLEAALAVWPAGAGTPPGTSSTFWSEGRASSGWLQLRGIFEVFVLLFSTVTRRILSRGGRPDMNAYSEELKFIEAVNWDDSAWHELAAPDKNKYLLRRVLDHLYAQAPYPVGAARVPGRVNAWMHETPTAVVFDRLPPQTAPLATATETSPITFSWSSTSSFAAGPVPKPVNAYETAVILIEQDKPNGQTDVLDQRETILTEWSVRAPPRGLDTSPGAKPVRISVTYSNLNGRTTNSFTHPAV